MTFLPCKDGPGDQPGLIDSLLPVVDGILGIRDSLGAVIDPVFIVTRTWSGTEMGDGVAKDTEAQILPSPGLKKYAQDVRLREGGAIKAGDIFLIDVSRNKYGEKDLDATTDANNIERLYRVGDKIYQVINIEKKYVTWNVQLRELTNQQRYV